LDDEMIQANPAQQLGKGFLKAKDRKEDITALTSEELKQLLDIHSISVCLFCIFVRNKIYAI